MAAGERKGKCVNIGNCALADKREIIVAKPGTDFVCPECGKSLIAVLVETERPRQSRGPLLVLVGLVALALLGGAFALKSCRAPESTEPTAAGPIVVQPGTPPPSPSPVAGEVKPVLRLGGSNTIGAALAPKLVAAYFREQGCANVNTQSPAADETVVSCEVGGRKLLATISAHGSSTAFEGMKSGAFDIGMASRKIKPDEVQSLAALGDMTAPSSEHVLGLDGIAIIVNPANRIESLTQDQVGAIFTGVVTKFSQVGGAAGDIQAYARDDKSGTFDTFKTLVLDKTPLVASAKRFEDGNELSKAVAGDPAGIGFVGLPAVGAAKVVAVAAPGAVSLVPNRFTIATEDYVLSRRLYLYTAANSPQPEVAQFVKFATSEKGQAVVGEVGFVPLTIREEKFVAPTGAPAEYEKLVRGALRLSVNFRFRTGSADLDNRGLADLDRVTEFLASSSVQPERLMLLGFADSRGSDAMNLKLSEDRARTVANALVRRGVQPGTVRGFGEAIPVADNSTPEGQEKNRRVEVWVKAQ
jgi:phosphate transport system substrate-binding protein